nr:hybrid sensor histidine kinase/response regulator transcription factor [Dyadobacter sp. UC 10]
MWVATLDGFCRYDGDEFRLFQVLPGDSSGLSGPDVISIQTDRQGHLLIETQQDLDLFDPRSETFFKLSHQPFYKKYFKKLPVITYPDRRQRIWLSNNEGLSVIDLNTNDIKSYRHEPGNPQSLSHDTVVTILEDRKGSIWAATRDGLNRLDEKTGRFTHYQAQPDTPGNLPDNDILGLYERPDGQLVILSAGYFSLLDPSTQRIKSYPTDRGQSAIKRVQFATDKKGNTYFSQYGNLYRFNEREGVACILKQESNSTAIIGLFIDRSDVLWLGTSGSGIYKYNLKATSFQTSVYIRGFYEDLMKIGVGLSQEQIPVFPFLTSSYYFRYTLDGHNNLWFNIGGTPFHYVNTVTGKVTEVPLPISFNNQYPLSPVPLATDADGRVWVLYDSLALWYDAPAQKWKSFPHAIRLPDSDKEPVRAWNQTHILQFTVDQTALWIATDKKGLLRIDRKTGHAKQYLHNSRNPASLSSDLLFCLFADPEDANILWIGTFGSGLCKFDKTTGKSLIFNTGNGLPNNVIYAAIPDQQGNIWIATNRGLCRMNRKTLKKRTFTREDGILADEFNRFHFVHLPDDRILLGGLEGITAFYPSLILDDSYQPEVEITGIRVNNLALEPGPSSLIDSLSVQQVNEIKLKYHQNSLTVEFAGLQYDSHKSLQYRYQLVGLDDNWIYPKRGEAIYTNLTAGKYTLKLNTTNTIGAWSPHTRSLSIVISPPWWASWWAYLVYFLALVYAGYVLIRLYVKEKETQQLRAVDELKTRFFSNITHDFRTPLTLILGPVQQLRSVPDGHLMSPINLRYINVIERNARQLLQLVNQLLDLSKAEAKLLQVEAVRGNLVQFIKELLFSFQAQADEQQIQLSFHDENINHDYYFDAEKLERILYNLVANALKFTQQKGSISVCLTGKGNEVSLAVADTGYGIPAEKLPNIFVRFYQVNSTMDFQQQGTGIGLSLVKELVELQGGRIEVTSTLGEGARFEITLPYNQAQARTEAPRAIVGSAHQDDTQTPNILVVEDNQELAAYIADSLPPSYSVALAKNGQEGYDATLRMLPDLIISDVMMPVMDGLTFCGQVKQDIRTSHIPVILLTAKSSQESKITGLTYGADDYLTKPFHAQELALRVQNLLERQRRQREWVQSQFSQPNASLTPSEETNPFLIKLFNFFEANFENALFGVDDIVGELGMSRMTLFRKVKTLTGYAPSDLIRNYRLNRATELLKKGESISETAFKVGFNSQAYFTKCFRDFYNMTPSEFIKKQP